MLIGFSTNAQHVSDFKTIDSLSYYLYSNAKWQELSEINTTKDIDYHYLNLRIGIAFFQLKKYHRAEKYLLKAYQQNQNSNVTAYYLYYTSVETGNLFLTAQTHSYAIGDSIKFTKIISAINVGGGSKLSANKEMAGNINFYNVGLGHFPAKKLALFQNFTLQNQQNNIWGDFTQQQYYLGSSIKLSNKWSVDFSIHLHQYKANIDFKYDSSKTASTPPAFPDDFKTDSIYRKNHLLKGTYNQQGAFFYLGLTHISGPLKISPFAQLNLENPSSSISETQWTEITISRVKPQNPPIENTQRKDSTIKLIDYPNNEQQIIIGTSIQYTLPFAQEKFTIGSVFYQPLKGRDKLIFSPFAKIKLKKSSLFISYLKKNNIPITEYYGSFLQNSYDNIHHQVNVRFSKPLSLKTSVNLFYQFEDKTDALSLVRFNSNLLSFSISFKL